MGFTRPMKIQIGWGERGEGLHMRTMAAVYPALFLMPLSLSLYVSGTSLGTVPLPEPRVSI